MEQLYDLLESAADRKRLTRGEKEVAVSLFDGMYTLLEAPGNPPGFRLATGEVAKGATGRTALNAYFLLLGRLALGTNYTRMDKRMGYWHMYLGFNIMRSNFGGWAEKGIYCCAVCTLSVLPLYCVYAFDAFDCDPLRDNVVKAISEQSGRFAVKHSRKYEEWAMRFV